METLEAEADAFSHIYPIKKVLLLPSSCEIVPLPAIQRLTMTDFMLMVARTI